MTLIRLLYNNNITISIDDVYLNITYTVLFPDTQTNLHIFFNRINKTSNPVYEHPVNQDINITGIIHINDRPADRTMSPNAIRTL